MIARIAFKMAGRPLVATLGDDLRWSVPGAEAIAWSLQVRFPVLDDSPAVGTPGAAQAEAAADWLKGTLTFAPTDPEPAGTIY